MHIEAFIKCYSNMLSKDMCRQLIARFESDPQSWERYDRQGTPNFNQLVLGIRSGELITRTIAAIQKYQSEAPSFVLPNKISLEDFRIKKYAPGGDDRFDLHCDAVSRETCHRYLVIFWYLNDVDVGGETEFPSLGLKFKPEAGTVIMFPPNWMYPHQGNPPMSGPKYLLSTYLHYL